MPVNWSKETARVNPKVNLIPKAYEEKIEVLPKFSCSFVRWAALTFFVLIFSSCASLSPVSMERERPVVFSSIDAVRPVWQDFANGIGYFHGTITSPRLEFWALKIDLSSPYIGIFVSGGTMSNEPAADGYRTYSARVTSFVRDNNLIAGINAVPFDYISSAEGRPIQNMGIVVSQGRLIAPARSRYDALVFFSPEFHAQTGRSAIVNQASIYSIEKIEYAVGGFSQILVEGELTERILHTEVRHPRSAAGVSHNGGYLFLLVIDGRRLGSIGATEADTARLLYSFGSRNGINFDGGGSSTLALRYPDGRIRTANTPIHRQIPGRERAVAGSLGIALILPGED